MSSSHFATALGHLAIVGLAGLIAYFVTLWRTRRRRICSSIVAFLVVGFAVCLTQVFLWKAPVAEVRIHKPAESSKVESLWISVEGVVSPPDASVQLLVHPSSAGSGQSWWVQPAPKQVGGAWKGDICLGTDTSGQGQYFQVIAIASPRTSWFGGLRLGRISEGQRLDEIPALPRSDIVTLWRSE